MSVSLLPPKATPLNAVHRALGARMVDFGGWDMPVNYGSQINEHHAVRRDVGMFDVSHMCAVDVRGETGSVRRFLRGILANNVDKLQTPGRALYSCMLNPNGGVIDDLIVYFFSEQWFRLVVNAGTAESDLAWLRAQNQAQRAGLNILPLRPDLVVNDASGAEPQAMIAVQGPNARGTVWRVLPETRASGEALKPFHAVFAPLVLSGQACGTVMVARTGYTGEEGLELIFPAAHAQALWDALAAAGAQPCGLGARDTLRLEAGMNLYGQDMDATISPLDAGLGWTVDLADDRDFIGRRAMLARGPSWAFAGLLLTDKGGILRAHQKVTTRHGDGEVTSGTFSPTLQQSIAMARLPVGIVPGDTVEVDVRGRRLAATVVKLPFVRHGKRLVGVAPAAPAE